MQWVLDGQVNAELEAPIEELQKGAKQGKPALASYRVVLVMSGGDAVVTARQGNPKEPHEPSPHPREEGVSSSSARDIEGAMTSNITRRKNAATFLDDGARHTTAPREDLAEGNARQGRHRPATQASGKATIDDFLHMVTAKDLTRLQNARVSKSTIMI